MRRLSMCFAILAAAGAALTAAAAPASAHPPTSFPTTIALPDGFPPEGIAIDGHLAYFGSRLDGSIYRADLRTGTGAVLSKGRGTPSLGLKIDQRGRLFVAGGTGGDARGPAAPTRQGPPRHPLPPPPPVRYPR